MYSVFMKVMTMLLTVVFLVITVATGAMTAGSNYGPKDPKTVELNAVVIADVHTDGDTFRDRNILLNKVFRGIGRNTAPTDALVIAGDITNSATYNEYYNLQAMLTIHNKAGQIVPALGNHDYDGTSDGYQYETAFARFRDFCGWCGIETQKAYYSAEINGFRFLVLGSEALAGTNAYISRLQIEWLDGELTAAESAGKPVFIVAHQPLKGTNGVSWLWSDGGPLGEQSDDVRAVIEKHTAAGLPVVYMSGHLHEDFSAVSFEEIGGNFYCLNLPSVQYTQGGGRAVTLECYPDEVLIRTRDFLKGEWLEEEYCVKY